MTMSMVTGHGGMTGGPRGATSQQCFVGGTTRMKWHLVEPVKPISNNPVGIFIEKFWGYAAPQQMVVLQLRSILAILTSMMGAIGNMHSSGKMYPCCHCSRGHKLHCYPRNLMSADASYVWTKYISEFSLKLLSACLTGGENIEVNWPTATDFVCCMIEDLITVDQVKWGRGERWRSAFKNVCTV